MSSSFMGLYVQREALNIAQKALDITGNNISNMNTSGYTRQRVDIVSVANSKGTLGYNTSIALAGQGSSAVGVAQVRDRLLDKRVRTYSGDLCNVGVKVNTLSDVEDVFDSIEADDLNASFAYSINNFKSALQSFSADNADRSELANVAMNSAQSLVQCVITYNDKLDDIASQTLEDANKTVDRINEILAEMGNLNKQIKSAYVSMGYLTPTIMNYEVMNNYGPLELKDSMNSLLDELGQYGNIGFKEEVDGTFTVEFAGQTVVCDKRYAQMALSTVNPSPTNLEYIIATGTEKTDKNPYGLLEKDEWYDLHITYETGGNSQVLLRDIAVTELKTFNITGVDAQGEQYLDSGSLRGYLDVYNGRGGYGKDTVKYSYSEMKNIISEANDILYKMEEENATAEDKARLETLIGAEVDGDGNVTLDGKTVDGSLKLHVDDNYDDKIMVFRLGSETVEIGGMAKDAMDNDADMVDIGNTEKGIEYYRDMLNAFVKTATTEFNDIFKDFTTKAKDGTDVTVELFTYEDSCGIDNFRTAAENFRVTDIWNDNPEIIANPSGDNLFEELDNTYINKMLGLFSVELSYGNGKYTDSEKVNLEKYVQHICDDLGDQVSKEQSLYDATDVMLTGVEEARSEVMDVSLNEEGINMINYQKWYNAISRMVTTLDEALEKLINGTGVVGLR